MLRPLPAMDLSQQTLNLDVHQLGVPGTGLGKLLQSRKHTDVTFLVDGSTPVPAHRVILASQSSYFECLLYGPMREGQACEIQLAETPPEAFQELLQFVYTGTVGTLSVMTALELMMLADRFGFPFLKDEIEETLLPTIDACNVLQFYCHARVSNASRLQEDCETFIDSNSTAVITNPSLLLLPKQNLISLLSRDSLIVDEILVFRAVQKWMKSNEAVKEEMGDLLNCIRLSEIPRRDLMREVRPSGLYEVEKVVDIALQESASPNKFPRGKRGEDINLFAMKSTRLQTCDNYLLHIIPEKEGKWSCVSDFLFRLICPASQEPGCITVQFNSVYLVNHIVFDGSSGPDDSDDDHTPFSYQVWVSKEGHNWTTIVDYSILKCCSMQRLFFPEVPVRFVRILQTRGQETFTIHLLSCSYVGPLPYVTRPLGIVAPFIPLNPNFSQYVRSIDNGVRCFVTLHQPYSISKLRLQMRQLEGSANIAVSVSKQNKAKLYQEVGKFKNVELSSVVQVEFQESIVTIVSITITEINLNKGQSPQRFKPINVFAVENLVCQAAN